MLTGVFAPHFLPVPASPDGAQTALNGLMAKCRRDEACLSHFPAFGKRFYAVMRQFDRGPVPVA